MVSKKQRNLIFIGLTWGLTILGYVWLVKQPFSGQLKWLAQEYKLGLLIALVTIKIVGLVWPPLPGGILTLGAVPFLGWQWAYLTDLAGTAIGALVAYYLAYNYGFKFLDKIFDDQTVNKIKSLKVKPGRATEFSFFLSLSSRLILTEASYYACGLLKTDVKKFFVGIIASHLLLGVPSYYFTGVLLNTNKFYLGILALVVLIPLWIKARRRYFE